MELQKNTDYTGMANVRAKLKQFIKQTMVDTDAFFIGCIWLLQFFLSHAELGVTQIISKLPRINLTILL